MFSLEMSAVEVLVEALKLPRQWQPFELPHAGKTIDDRKRYVERVWDDLRRRGLATRDRLDADLEEALRVWAQPDILVVIRASEIEDDRLVLFRGAAAHGVGVLSEQIGGRIDFDVVKSDQLVGLMVSQLPPYNPVPLREVTVTRGPTPPAHLGPRPAPAATKAFASWPVERFGGFELSMRTRNGRMSHLGTVQFTDTIGGRFVVWTTPLPNGEHRTTLVPSDGSHVRRWLYERIALFQEERP